MRFTTFACALALSSVAFASPQRNRNGGNGGNANAANAGNANAAGNGGNNNGGNNGGNNNNGATGTTLVADAIQSGSFSDGGNNGQAADGQALSKTSQNNFINNCAGKTLTNGLQVTTGSCNGIRKYIIPLCEITSNIL